ncbi:DNA/RNA polymerase [Rickenella mellea]|uniref:DNA-directed RNA polymerase n=1 Tax=Rickenella mellea TaxID=50990 RepID=A0A4Y7QJK7_9AGAM|nr:DNA/RNA polymerase [Rickenella mellea]
MENGTEKVAPAAGTYATMLLMLHRFGPDSENSIPHITERTYNSLLRCILDRQIPLALVVSDKAFLSSEEASKIVSALSRAAVEMSLSKVVTELGQVELMGSDPLENVPEVTPVIRHRVRIPIFIDGELKPAPEIPFNIDNLRKHLSDVAFARRVLPQDTAARQKLLEASVYDVAVQRLRHQEEVMENLGVSDQHTLLQAQLQQWMYAWHEKLKARLKTEIAAVIEEEQRLRKSSSATASTNARLGPFLSLLKPEKLSLITILELMRLQGSGGIAEGMKTARALLTVGKSVELEHRAEVCKKNNVQVPMAPAHSRQSLFSRKAYQDLQTWRVTAQHYVEDAVEYSADWSQVVRARIGSFLVDCLMDVATVQRTAVDKRTGEEIEEEQPAFFHSYEYVRGHKLGVIRLNPAVSERLSRDSLRETLHPRHLPMLVPPKPWLNHDNGGYLYNKTSVMRFKDTQEQLTYLRHASQLGHVELVYAGLDVLGSTPWRINKAIFDIVLQVWNSGQGLIKIPSVNFDVLEPIKPANYETDQYARSKYLNEVREWQFQRANAHSDRCNVNYKVEIARAFLHDVMYLPHNVDFRGRAYPIPPHLNHLGDDLSRGLLTFAESKPLGQSGLRWLKIHLANLYGYDKGSFEERVNFVREHLDNVYDSAENPLEGRMWWTKADDPWQCLATCMELRNALKSEDPEAFLSCLPVHQDGTCNGLQHYAALGGDGKGAQQVNLSATDRPSDVYTYVANMVERKVAEDAAKGHKVGQLVLGKISRKVVKQTVMTTVYGVTYVGARAQIERQLKDRGDIQINDCWDASSYIAKLTMESIGDLFSGAKGIQDWLTTSAQLIARSIPKSRIDNLMSHTTSYNPGVSAKRLPKEQMTSVVWTTPLGLPVVQPYRKTKRKQIMTSLQSVYISDPNLPSEVNAGKQASAFPPNFIHSLDATHMMLTALECRRTNLTFASVHDSYWTHASTIDKMSEIIRETFIALHSSEVLSKLHDEFVERYADYRIPLAVLRQQTMLKRMKRVGVKVPALSNAEVLPEDKMAEDEEEAVDDEASVVSAKPNGKRRSRKAKLSDAKDEVVLHQFVNLVDVLPPIPKKGDFDVQSIKKSLYFFS